MLEILYIADKKLREKKKLPPKNLCSQRQIHSVHTCKLSRAENYQRTLIPIKYEQPLPTHTYPKAQLYIVVIHKTNTESVTTKQNYRNLRSTRMYGKVRCLWHRLAVYLVVVAVRVVGSISAFKRFFPLALLRRPAHASLPLSLPLALQPLQPMASAS